MSTRRRKERMHRRDEDGRMISDRSYYFLTTASSIFFAVYLVIDYLSDGVLIIKGKEIPDAIAVVIILVFSSLAFALTLGAVRELND